MWMRKLLFYCINSPFSVMMIIKHPREATMQYSSSLTKYQISLHITLEIDLLLSGDILYLIAI